MPRVQFVPSGSTWSFDPESAPVSWAIPAGAGGGLTLSASTPGSTPVDGEGVIFSVSFNGVPSYTSACMENGTDMVAVPPGTTQIDVTVARGCAGGAVPTTDTVSGAGA